MIVETFYPTDASDFQEIHSFEDIAPRTVKAGAASSRRPVADFTQYEYPGAAYDAPAASTRTSPSTLVAVAAAGILLGIALRKTS